MIKVFSLICLCEKNANMYTTQIILENGVYIYWKDISSSLSKLQLELCNNRD